jgi:hypothetical protein
VLLSLPFGGVVLQKIGVSKPEIEAILEDFRRMYTEGDNVNNQSFDFLESFRRRLPSSEPESSSGGINYRDDASDYLSNNTDFIPVESKLDITLKQDNPPA